MGEGIFLTKPRYGWHVRLSGGGAKRTRALRCSVPYVPQHIDGKTANVKS